MFLIHLIRHKWDANAPYPGFKTLSQRMGITPQAVRIHARNLEKNGYLRREFKIGETNRFQLGALFFRLEDLIAKDASAAANGKISPPTPAIASLAP